jgi:hypothetical protein
VFVDVELVVVPVSLVHAPLPDPLVVVLFAPTEAFPAAAAPQLGVETVTFAEPLPLVDCWGLVVQPARTATPTRLATSRRLV